jgi:hypothetical protein
MDMTSSILRSTLAAGPVLEQLQRRVVGALRGALALRPRCIALGHDDEVSRDRHRLFLRCAHCGRETPGWTVGPQQYADPPADTTPSLTREYSRSAPAMRRLGTVLRAWLGARIAEVRHDAQRMLAGARAVWSRVERGGIRLRLPRLTWPGSGRR